jgi:hypothetical protein
MSSATGAVDEGIRDVGGPPFRLSLEEVRPSPADRAVGSIAARPNPAAPG